MFTDLITGFDLVDARLRHFPPEADWCRRNAFRDSLAMAILLVSRHNNNTVNSELKNELVFEGIRYLRNALGCENWKRAHATQTQNKRRKNLKENAT